MAPQGAKAEAEAQPDDVVTSAGSNPVAGTRAGVAQLEEAATHAQTLAPALAFAAERQIDRVWTWMVGCRFKSGPGLSSVPR